MRRVSRLPYARGRRYIGEQSGLSAIADRAATVRRHDVIGLSVGETMVDSYAPWGFTVNGVALEGPVLLLPRASYLLQMPQPDELITEGLAVLDLLEVRIGTLVIGSGKRPWRVPADVRGRLHDRFGAVEFLTTPHACSTFNFMVQEQRSVAAVLWPISDTRPLNRHEKSSTAKSK